MDDSRIAEMDIIISELAGNLIRHRAKRGYIRASLREEHGRTCIEIRSDDEGPGIKDVLNLTEGISSGGGLGVGLKSVARLSDVFNITSEPGKGTHVKILKWIDVQSEHHFIIHIKSRPLPGELVSGDLVMEKNDSQQLAVFVIDALGHGEEAHESVEKAKVVIDKRWPSSLEEVFRDVHMALKGMRGAAMTGAILRKDNLQMSHLGIGNVEMRVASKKGTIRPFCLNGTLGAHLPRLTVNTYQLSKGDRIFIFTDGISTQFEQHEDLFADEFRVLIDNIFNQYARVTDDATLVGIEILGM
ncbi:MAG: hypothetical protein D6732_26055 [Methanobacteriota archaeon]|nr:MAG: hypothetical protein D6732_26055 [Euryarchaeota archaeon]